MDLPRTISRSGLVLLVAVACSPPVDHPSVPAPEPFRLDLRFASNQRGFPERTCERPICGQLRRAIDEAKSSIDFAIYGVRGQDTIIGALAAAAERGVRVRGVVDTEDPTCTAFGYADTPVLIQALAPGSVVCDTGDAYAAIMHNKFFVFDSRRLWTGSTNISDTELGGEYSTNVAALIDSRALARVYEREFEQMYEGRFHDHKMAHAGHEPEALLFSDGTIAQSYFSPADRAVERAVLPLIDGAVHTLDVAMFYFTNQAISEALILAHSRGVVVRMILDAVGADSEYSEHPRLCEKGVRVKIENFGGKSHGKWAVADADLPDLAAVVFGSMNWTGAGAARNDENTILLKNAQFARRFAEEFERQWSELDAVAACTSVAAEGADSSIFVPATGGMTSCQSGSCCDGIDNDYDAKIDLGEETCACADGVDNDADGYVDVDDYDCGPARRWD